MTLAEGFAKIRQFWLVGPPFALGHEAAPGGWPLGLAAWLFPRVRAWAGPYYGARFVTTPDLLPILARPFLILVVRGHRHVYKIHLGSGNILMEPNGQYLCIVPDRSAKTLGAPGVFLPFEGDAVLSIILSKALLLMDDDKITDPTILRQL